MNILALDTCTECCSVAVHSELSTTQKLEMTQRGHSEQVLAMLDSALNEAKLSIDDIDVIAFGRGPGGFTGVRIGVGVAQGIAFAKSLPVAAVSSLAAVAQTAMTQYDVDDVAVAMDARMGEIYAGHFTRENGIAILVDIEQVCSPHLFKPFDNRNWLAAGTGWQAYQAVLSEAFSNQLSDIKPNVYPTAESIIKLAQKVIEDDELISAEMATPVYLRDNVAKKKGEQK